MSNALLNSILGQATSTINSLPVDSNVHVPSKAVFGKFFNNMLSAFTGNQGGINLGNGQMQGLGGITNPTALQAFNNARPNGLPFNASGLQNYNTQSAGPALLQPPGIQSNLAYQQAQLQGLAPGVSGLQGFAGQQNPYGNTQQSSLPGGPVGFGGFGLPNAGGGKFQMLLYPVLGLVSVFKSIFGIRSLIANGMHPIRVSKENLAFNQTKTIYSEYDQQEGSFDEFSYPNEKDPEQGDQSIAQHLNEI
jgi:hypothetical protein